MDQDVKFKRSSTKRRNTDLIQLSRSNTNQSDKSSQTDLAIPASLFEDLSKIIDPETSALELIYSVIIKLLKSCTNSSWVEFAVIEENTLKICSSYSQQHKVIEIDPKISLLGHVAVNQMPILLTNPHTSAFYSQFPIKLQAFSLLTKSSVKPNSIACIPVYVIYK
jgi:hypothetical protein